MVGSKELPQADVAQAPMEGDVSGAGESIFDTQEDENVPMRGTVRVLVDSDQPKSKRLLDLDASASKFTKHSLSLGYCPATASSGRNKQ
jgi:hypothetical protein